ncbi:MAG: hypothetical protein MK108_07435 [Mariniblastus sp.]|nr:hypothetical protein [Mariniblastus sp.]
MTTPAVIDDLILPERVAPAGTPAPPPRKSWPFLASDGTRWLISRCFGIVSIIFLVAAAASLPIVQLVSFGYLLEVSGRLARGGKFSTAMIGLEKAARLGGVLLGTWLLLLPIRLVSLLWYEAYLIDPGSQQTAFLRILQITLIGLTLVQILAAWLCGGKLRYFFWQAVAPFSFIIWLVRKTASSNHLRPALNVCLGWISPYLVQNLCDTRPLTDWFVPAILLKKFVKGTVYTDARDGLWNFVASLHLWFYFKLGLKGFIGTFLWLVVPTAFLMGGTATDTLASLGSALIGFAMAVPLFILLPFMQAHFARQGAWRGFLQPFQVLANFWRAPLAHLVALLLTLTLALPLFLLKIEEIPTELLWTLSLVFVVFTWPSHIAIGLAYRRGNRPGKQGRWWISLPVMFLAIPLSFTFVFIMFFTRYVTWNGMWSLLENHVFLLPAPFWL